MRRTGPCGSHHRPAQAEVPGRGQEPEQVDKLDLKDDVLRRANGFYTYFAADIAYHRNKLEQQGFSRPSTSGAPTTTATWPASRLPWTAWAWTAPTG